MSRKLGFRLTTFLLLIWLVRPALGQEFSAEMVRLKPQGAAASSVSVSKNLVRFEVNGQAMKSYVILDLTQRTSSMVLPENKSYVVSPPGHTPSSIPFFNIDDPGNACPAWERSVARPGTCAKVGNDTVNGRSTVKYTGTADNGDTGTAWVDRKLHFVVKWEGTKGAAELQNIQEAPQAASLFQIPADYEKMDPSALRQAEKKKMTTISPKHP